MRCASALTHPATVVALATLLLNDVVFKAMWPHAWVTGKLSDLAWVVFALPLLAFLLSLLTRGNVAAARAAFVTAYIGLPMLYAAFNTFQPVHYWILRGISLASGGMGRTPLDATDSLVIPFGWAIAAWVWRRPALSQEALRLRWGLLVAGVAVLASVATTLPERVEGIVNVSVSAGGTFYAEAQWGSRSRVVYQSLDSGLNWTRLGSEELTDLEIVWGDYTASAPRGRYEVRGSNVLLTGTEGDDEVLFSAEHLLEHRNLWLQEQATKHFDRRKITTKPGTMAYDDQSGNVVVAMGILGVLVGIPDGRWTPYAVGPYLPYDFSFFGKARILLTNIFFWAAALALSSSMTSAGVLLAKYWREDSRKLAFSGLIILAALASSAVLLPVIAYILLFSPILALVSLVAIGFGISKMPKTWLESIAVAAGILSLVAAGFVMIIFGESTTAENGPSRLVLGGISAAGLGVSLVSFPFAFQLRYWRVTLVSLAGMNVLVLFSIMLWLHLGISLDLAKLSALALTGVAALVLAEYVRRKRISSAGVCRHCRHSNEVTATFCNRCGRKL